MKMRRDRPRWKCHKCNTSVAELFYCAMCWKVVCEDCYDPFVGVCKDCISRLTKNIGELQQSEVETKRGSRKFFSRCRECNTPLIITPDKTKCCPSCGLVVGRGYSWIGHAFNPPREDYSTYHPIDNSRW